MDSSAAMPTNKPIFVVGTPRSGTSILTWCLGQHPNIFALEESAGMGDLAVTLAACDQTKTALGSRLLFSALDVQNKEFFANIGQTINALILRHRVDLERKRWEEAAAPNSSPDDFLTEQSTDPKARWVNGTPEYSFHICGLRKLFPDAMFVHIVRDVTSVVRSMLNFHRIAGVSLVASEQEAYDYWFRAVSSCLLAERAYGSDVIFRLRYSELVDQPETCLRSLFSFLGEPFAAACLNPLRKRINSSNVPADFKLGSAETDPAIIERATQLNAEIETTPQPAQYSSAAAEQIEAAFNQRVQYVASLDGEYTKVQQAVVALQVEREQMRRGYEAELQRLNSEREQMREGYETEWQRLELENAKIASRAERLANEVKGKRAIIDHLRARRQHYNLRRLFFGRHTAKRNGK
jgi:hypothetical protein